jgi:hypothetical protein
VKGKTIYINQQEAEAIYLAQDYVANILERCFADEDTEDGRRVLCDLRNTIDGLQTIQNKLTNRNS